MSNTNLETLVIVTLSVVVTSTLLNFLFFRVLFQIHRDILDKINNGGNNE